MISPFVLSASRGWVGSSSSPPAWTPASVSASWCVDAHAALAGGRLWTTSGKATLVAAPGDPVGDWEQEYGLTPDMAQATTGARGYLSTVTSGASAVGFDNIDDRLTSAQAFSAGAKTIGLRFQYHAALGSSEIDVPLTLGATPSQFRLAIGGATSTFPGVQWVCDVAGSSTAFTKFAWTPDTSEHTLLIVYNGGAIGSSASYRAWLDGVEKTLSGGSSSLASGTSSVGAISVGSAAAGIKVVRGFLAPSDLASVQADVHTWL